jgi:RNA polymerase-binding transcription factor
MNVERYRRRLQELEARLARRTTQLRDEAAAQRADAPSDAGDASTSDVDESEALSEAELDATTLQQVRDALLRIENGTFGRCVIDGGAIEEKRLEAVPWTPYCARHAQVLEAESGGRTPTL